MIADEARVLLADVTQRWVDDPESAAVWCGDHEGRRGVRIAQQVRDFTTVWFSVGDYTVTADAYVLPPPVHNREDVYRQCLVRNATGPWRVAFGLDREGAVFLRGRIPLECLTTAELDATLGAVYDVVESSFRGLTAASKREKNP